jgi:lipopolysaccharide/colanic/teichoic acid biosynthesis glycosyltransferase
VSVAVTAGVRPASARRDGIYDRWGKRLLDVVIAGVALAVLLPLLALIAVAVLARMGRPVLFEEVRAPRGGVPVALRKFRTMTNDRDASGRLLDDERRLTPLGRLLRECSLDELPELVNVLRGEMSLVGPRPLPVRYVARYTPKQARRLEVVCGITGLAQTRGRNALSWERRFALDVWYVDHRSAWLDARLLLATVAVVARRAGVSHPGHVTMHEFAGSAR